MTGGNHIDPSAIVEEGAWIGSGSRIWHHAHVRAGATIGTGCIIGKNVFIDSGVTVGDRCKIQNNVSIYRGVTLENDIFVGPSAVFTNDLRPRAGNQDWEICNTHIETGASIGANATILCGITLGRYSMIGAGSVVTRSVPAYTLVVGNPARIVGAVCECGRTIDAAAQSDSCLHGDEDD